MFPNKGGNKRKWLPHLCFFWGPKRGRKCYVTAAFSGVPNSKRGEEIRCVPQQRGKQTKVAASPLPSRGPTRG